MKIKFYRKETGKEPVLVYLEKIPINVRSKISACLKEVQKLGFDAPRVQFRQIRGKLWEITIKVQNGGYRIFYVVIKLDVMVLLHIYKKQSQKAPIKEIELAESRMKGVLNNESYYF